MSPSNGKFLDSTELSQLDDSSKNEMVTFLDNETSKQKVQMSIHQFTNTCFRNCVASANSSSLSPQEEQCLANCVNNFLDTKIRVVKGLQHVKE
ncbi:hypothetical protein KAFR_0E04370 [Kazachstania africana CBS 2517]|uniref:Mitochondrial import inner membrane translocase subunit n=1 Tax=Kazachstania africana (strain ATCC 22294 / BCRC 22015 / CBS 2517 / CECT 1963 / NBRC 1671 / NRRL Y-8276) TaxID=1071382 RepID=H2AW37_KAZAF|nr:hypothetical protein KAFR_0E04370 [Kazachstania africana CBS 2517]CCF58587.1 hypothetical protein KAFR_0E04370 [Kazachstania africana CBS 2517]